MKLSLDESPTYMLPVALPVRMKDGSLVSVKLRLEVKRLDQDEYGELLERFAKAVDPTIAMRFQTARKEGRLDQLAAELENEQLPDAKKPVDAMREELRTVIVGWEAADFDPPVEFSESALNAVLRKPAATQVIFYKLGESIPTAKEKNSPRSP